MLNISRWDLKYFRTGHYINRDNVIDDYSKLPRPFSSIGYILSGSWSYKQNFGNSDELRCGEIHAGELFYIPQGSTYTAIWHGGDKAESDCISLHFELSGGIFNSRRTMIQRVEPIGGDTRGEFEQILRKYGQNRTAIESETENICAELELISDLYRIISLVTLRLDISESSVIDPRLEPAFEYIQTHLTEKISVAELALLCCLSEPYFYILFKKATGRSFIEYKNSVVISNAERMLIDFPDLSVEDLSEQLGFSSSAYFRRTFKHFTGYSPSNYRKNHIRHMI